MSSLLAKRLVELRKEAGLCQMEVAEEVSAAENSVSGWEHGVCEPSSERLIKLADLFGVTLDYLYGRSDDPKKGAFD